MLSEVGDPILEDDNEDKRTNSEDASKNVFKSAKKLSEKNSRDL